MRSNVVVTGDYRVGSLCVGDYARKSDCLHGSEILEMLLFLCADITTISKGLTQCCVWDKKIYSLHSRKLITGLYNQPSKSRMSMSDRVREK